VPDTVSPHLTGTSDVTVGQVGVVVIVLPGGRATSRARFRSYQAANLRMIPFRWSLRRALGQRPVAVWLLKYRYRGWNEPELDPVHDVSWALGYARRHHPGAAVILVGHSMGGRAALRAAGDPSVVAVCALAPWVEPDEPVSQLLGRAVLIVHGNRDRIASPQASFAFANQAQNLGVAVRWVSVVGDGHAMMRKAGQWAALAGDFVRTIVDSLGPQHSIMQ
jgi:pimeloyl-ACP methyl ester carboxylesterase